MTILDILLALLLGWRELRGHGRDGACCESQLSTSTECDVAPRDAEPIDLLVFCERWAA